MEPNESVRDSSPTRRTQPNTQEAIVATTLSTTLPIPGKISKVLVSPVGIKHKLDEDYSMDVFQIKLTHFEDSNDVNIFTYLSRQEANKHLSAFGIPAPGLNFSIVTQKAAYIHPGTLDKHTVLVETKRRKLKIVE